ncbi:hypothetical protein J6590_057555 [Homalodisca vitripennis]|nr:hypothetical protein J6590_057555 [Homalodisca vitripennis]
MYRTEDSSVRGLRNAAARRRSTRCAASAGESRIINGGRQKTECNPHLAMSDLSSYPTTTMYHARLILNAAPEAVVYRRHSHIPIAAQPVPPCQLITAELQTVSTPQFYTTPPEAVVYRRHSHIPIVAQPVPPYQLITAELQTVSTPQFYTTPPKAVVYRRHSHIPIAAQPVPPYQLITAELQTVSTPQFYTTPPEAVVYRRHSHIPIAAQPVPPCQLITANCHC